MEPVTVALVGSAALQTFSRWRSNRAARRAAEERARLMELQAQEVLNRNRINSEEVRRQTSQLIGKQQVSIAGSGADLASSSVTLTTLQDSVSNMSRTLQNMDRDARFRAAQIRAGAGQERQMASQLRKSAPVDLLTGGLQAYGSYKMATS